MSGKVNVRIYYFEALNEAIFLGQKIFKNGLHISGTFIHHGEDSEDSCDLTF